MLYLIRHAQAGPRGSYDELSSLGQQQARLLGQYLSSRKIRFNTIYTGSLQRQQHTARIICDQLQTSSVIITDERWNELRLGEIYSDIASLLCQADRQFAINFAQMQEQLREDTYATDGAVAECDRAVMMAWLEERFPLIKHENWHGFQAKIHQVFSEIILPTAAEDIAVCTSATPIAMIVGSLMQMGETEILKMLWGISNSGITTLRKNGDAWMIEDFNQTPHLLEERLRTVR